jgi:transcriptional regulator with XRE-family HTH domain
LELHSSGSGITFHLLQGRLLAFVNARIRNGEFSERSLAHRLGVSQPQLHNVLKGERKLHVDLADALLAKFQISVVDLLQSSETGQMPERAADPFAAAEQARLRLIRKRLPFSRRDRTEWEAS